MKKVLFFICFCLAFFACTIEKRHYFKGYNIEWLGTQSKRPSNDAELSLPGTDSVISLTSSSSSLRPDSQVVISDSKIKQDCTLKLEETCFNKIEADQILAPPQARVSQNLDSTQYPIDWSKINHEHQVDSAHSFPFDKSVNPDRDPPEAVDIAKSFLTGLSSILFGVLLILLSGNEGSLFAGMLPFGIILVIIGLVVVIVAIVRISRHDVRGPDIKSKRKSVGLFKRGFWKV
jgi:hypothetical protein